MSLNRYAKARDKNEPHIVAALEGRRWLVEKHGDSAFDLSAQCPRCACTLSVEVKVAKDPHYKQPAGKLTKRQAALIARGWTLHVLSTIADVDAMVGDHYGRCLRPETTVSSVSQSSTGAS